MSIGKDTAYNLAAALAPALFMLAVTPFYLHAIGPARFGVLAICWTLVSALKFASLGMGPSLAYRLPKMNDASRAARSSLVWTALILAFVASLVGAILVVGIGEIYFRYFFTAPTGLDAEIRRALPMLAALLPVSILIGVLNGALQGMRRFGVLSAITIVNAALFSLLPLGVALLVTVHLNALIVGTVAANALVALAQFVVCARLVPLGAPHPTTRSDAAGLLGYGAWMSGTALLAPLVLLLDRFVIGALRGPAAVGVYVLPYNLVQQLVLLPASVGTAVLPRLAALPDDKVRQLQSTSLVSLNSVLTPLSVIAIALAGPFFHLWIGPTLAAIASPVAVVLLVGGWAHGVAHIPAILLQARNRPDVVTKLLLAGLVPYVLTLAFATYYFGLIGAATAWTIRAAFDPLLFIYTRPLASDLRHVAGSGLLVLTAMGAALLFPWTSAIFWALMAAILTAACYQNRRILVSSAVSFRAMTQALAQRSTDAEMALGDGSTQRF